MFYHKLKNHLVYLTFDAGPSSHIIVGEYRIRLSKLFAYLNTEVFGGGHKGVLIIEVGLYLYVLGVQTIRIYNDSHAIVPR